MAAALRQALGAADESPESILAGLNAVLAEDEQAELVTASVGALLTGVKPDLPGPAVSVDETAWAVRKVLEALCRKAPLVVVLDDLQWAEPALLDLVDHVAEWTQDAPILLVCVARPELLDERPAWAGGKRNATSIHLEPLSEDESSALLRQRLDGAELDESVRPGSPRRPRATPCSARRSWPCSWRRGCCDDEAEKLAEVCRDAAAPDDVDSQMIWRTARAEILAARGDTDEAERLAAEALRLGDTTDLWVTADVQLDAGAVAAAAGRTDDARRLVRAAIDAYGRKGDRTSFARAERRLADLPPPTSGPAMAG